MVTKEEFADWRSHQVTQEMLSDLNKEAQQRVETILNSLVADANRDQFLKGYIQGLSYAIGFTPEFPPDNIAQTLEGQYMGANDAA